MQGAAALQAVPGLRLRVGIGLAIDRARTAEEPLRACACGSLHDSGEPVLQQSGVRRRNYEVVDSKQSAQLKKIIGGFADDQSTVFVGHLRNINHNARRPIEAGDGSADAGEQRDL
jgi:hypothetical protein